MTTPRSTDAAFARVELERRQSLLGVLLAAKTHGQPEWASAYDLGQAASGGNGAIWSAGPPLSMPAR